MSTNQPSTLDAAAALLEDVRRASMQPRRMRHFDQAEYDEAVAVAASILAEPVTLALPVAAGPREAGTGTLAALFRTHGACSSDRVAVEHAAARIAGWVNESTTVGSTRVYANRLASLTVSTEPHDNTAPRLFLIEVPTNTGLGKILTGEGKFPFAVLALFPAHTYQMTDRKTGEIIERVDLGNYNPTKVWAGNGGIVRMVTRDQAEGIELDWSWSPEVRNTAWALSYLRYSAAVDADAPQADRPEDTEPF